jgi:hypothetical protein
VDFVRIDRGALPPEEHEAVRTLESNLLQLQTLAKEFRYTVDLSVFAHDQKLANDGREEMWKFIAWMNVAGRNGAILACSFFMLMQEINSPNAPTIRGKVDLQFRKAATKLFNDEFPRINNIRDSAAHPGELGASKAEADRHRLKEGGTSGAWIVEEDSGTFMQGNISAREDGGLVYTSSFKGKLVDYELSMQKADILDEVAALYRAAYYPLESPASAAMRRRMLEIDELRRRDQIGRPQGSGNRF